MHAAAAEALPDVGIFRCCAPPRSWPSLGHSRRGSSATTVRSRAATATSRPIRRSAAARPGAATARSAGSCFSCSRRSWRPTSSRTSSAVRCSTMRSSSRVRAIDRNGRLQAVRVRRRRGGEPGRHRALGARSAGATMQSCDGSWPRRSRRRAAIRGAWSPPFASLRSTPSRRPCWTTSVRFSELEGATSASGAPAARSAPSPPARAATAVGEDRGGRAGHGRW